jgi:hypothetical protein
VSPVASATVAARAGYTGRQTGSVGHGGTRLVVRAATSAAACGGAWAVACERATFSRYPLHSPNTNAMQPRGFDHAHAALQRARITGEPAALGQLAKECEHDLERIIVVVTKPLRSCTEATFSTNPAGIRIDKRSLCVARGLQAQRQASASLKPLVQHTAGQMRVEYREYFFLVQPMVTGPQPVWGWEVHRPWSSHIVGRGRAGSPNAARDAARLCIDLQRSSRSDLRSPEFDETPAECRE